MHDVAIMGAGELGGAIAFALARRGGPGRIHLVDDLGPIAAGTALDITQAGPIERYSTRVLGGSDPIAAVGAGIIVIADRAEAAGRQGGGTGGEWQGDQAVMLLRQIGRLSPESVVVCAGAGQRELVERGVRELGFPRRQLFGSAPEALAAAVRAMVAIETNGSPGDVALSVLGVPPAHIVVPWEDATVSGFAATRVLDEPARRRLHARVAQLWPPGPYALATAAARTIDSLTGRSRRGVVAFVGPDDSAGRRTRAAALPVRLESGGIERVEVPPLAGRDRVALDNAMLL